MKTKFSFLIFLFVLTGALSLSSCGEDDESEIAVPNLSYRLDFNNAAFSDGSVFVAKGEYLTVNSFSLDEAKSSKGMHIDFVRWSLDGEEIATSTSSPFGFSYPMKNESIGKHKLAAYIEASGDGYANIKETHKAIATVYVTEEPYALDIDAYIDNDYIGDKPAVSNGETFSGHIELSESNTIDGTITKVEYYWDDEVFGASSKSPFTFNYAVNNEKTGNHKFKYVATINAGEYGLFTKTKTFTVVVK